jgi:hypothetical protein
LLALWRWWLYAAGCFLGGISLLTKSDDASILAAQSEQAVGHNPAFLLLAGVAIVSFVFVRARQNVVVYEGGFVWSRTLLGRREVAWRDVRNAVIARHYQRGWGSWTTLEIDLASGVHLSMSDVLEALPTLCSHATGPQTSMHPEVIAQTLRSGGTSTLGILVLSHAGFWWRGSQIAWGQIAHATRVGDDVCLDLVGPPAHRIAIPGADIGNPDVLVALVAMSRAS